jgi:hypothetical protein
MAERAVTLNGCELRREQTVTKHIRYASLLIRSTIEIDPQQDGVNFSAILTMNCNVIGGHRNLLVLQG